MITDKSLIGLSGPDVHDVKNIPTVEFSADDVQRIIAEHVQKDYLRRKRKKIPVIKTDTRLECFNPSEWAEYRSLTDSSTGARAPSYQEIACSDCTLAFQTTSILYGRCWPTNLRVTPLGRLYHGEIEDE